MTGVKLFKNRVLIGTVAALFAMLLWSTAASAAELLDVRFGKTSASETRIVFDSNGPARHQLDADAAGKRLTVTFSDLAPSSALAAAGKGVGQVSGYAASKTGEGRAVVAIDLNSPVKLKQVLVIPPGANPRWRLVVDLVGAKPGDLVASLPPKQYETITDVIEAVAPPSQSEPTEAPAAQPTLAASAIPVIVIDAGHGGSDPGAAGSAGTQESAATLSAALELAEALRETGRYEVVLTRSTDIRLAHEERSHIAREAKADLFISLHADAHSNRKVRGASVYTLSDEGTERSAREALATGNYNVFDLNIGEEDPEVGGILYNLAQRRTENQSDRFAELLIGKLSGVTPLLNNTHRRGNFKVLLAPDVPAVLLELAFISNKHDEANLGSAVWRKRTMGAAAGAIDAYFKERALAVHASNAASGSR